MKTDDLIRALAADNAVRPMPLRWAFADAMIPGVVIAFSLYLAILGPRPNFLGLLTEPRFLFKVCVAFLLVALSANLVMRLGKPGAEIRRATLLLAIVPVLLAAGNLAELISVPVGLWSQRLIGTNALFCLKSIPFLGLAPLAATLFCLRQGAPERGCGGSPCRSDRRGAMPRIARMIRRFSSRLGTRWRSASSPPLTPWPDRGSCAGEQDRQPAQISRSLVFAAGISRKSLRKILPTFDFGKSSRNSTNFGTL